jgi:hypothetical protein
MPALLTKGPVTKCPDIKGPRYIRCGILKVLEEKVLDIKKVRTYVKDPAAKCPEKIFAV